ncbi:AraC-like DNA-binding protein [Tenacibaculum gallaicum]|uniref:AraC-like DNA-binding protein n=1 Tax=Tenacibaculum gallaicum TaxID=561505 RepID=A0A3E0HM10_9FLAO|nr:helix-turn-helix domain-containing protein [Tenacibaculum gallaicum]REH47513.1 AraC-like DNA-binding protein [Tenacibaculum gallaicum]
MKKIFVLLLVIGLSLKVYSQNHIKQDTLLRKSFQELSDLFYNSKPDTLKAVIYAKAKYRKALHEKDTLEMLNGKYLLADILNDENIYLNFCDSLIEITKKYLSKKYPSIIHFRKGKFFFHRRRNGEALKEFLLIDNAEGYTSAYKNMYLGLIKSSVDEKENALFFYLKAFNYLKNKNKLHKTSEYLSLLNNITSIHLRKGSLDSAYYYNEKSIRASIESRDTLFENFSYFMRSLIDFDNKKYEKALTGFLRFVPIITEDENYVLLNQTYSLIGITYDSINNYSYSLKYHKKADSIYSIKNISSKRLEDSFKFLLKHYKAKNNLKKQLFYINRLLELKKFNLNEKNKINKTFTEEYDIPNLILEKKQVIEKLENEVGESRKNKIIYISLLLLSFVLIGYQIKRKRTFKKRFIALVNQKEVVDKEEIQPVTKTTNKYELSYETISAIMKGLETFEKNTDFLDSKINLQLLADRLDTNTSYLSKVINQYKNTSFSNYVNQLRIKYAIEKLKNDTLWRKYTIKAIAQEVGFKNAESFSKAFFKHTGLKPSYFIKELVKVNSYKSS